MRCLVWFSYGRPRVFALPDVQSFKKVVIAFRAAAAAGWGVEDKAFDELEKAILRGSVLGAEQRVIEFTNTHGLNDHEMFESVKFIQLE